LSKITIYTADHYAIAAASQLQWQGDEWAFLRMPELIFMSIRGQLGYLSQPASQPSSQPSEHTQPVAGYES